MLYKISAKRKKGVSEIMTLFYYLAAGRELPTGSFGQNKRTVTLMEYVTHINPAAKEQPTMQIMLEKYPEGDRLMDIYETELDAAGLYIAGPMHGQEASHIFRNTFIYQINPEGGSFTIHNESQRSNPILYERSQKCLTELFAYLRRNMIAGDKIELYCCWAYDRDRFTDTPIPELDVELDLSVFQLGAEFEWKERQYITIVA
jgi:hypothetical protein